MRNYEINCFKFDNWKNVESKPYFLHKMAIRVADKNNRHFFHQYDLKTDYVVQMNLKVVKSVHKCKHRRVSKFAKDLFIYKNDDNGVGVYLRGALFFELLKLLGDEAATKLLLQYNVCASACGNKVRGL